MSEKKIIIEGGGTSNNLRIRCRSGFKALLVNTNPRFTVFQPIAKGSRREAYNVFKSEHEKGKYYFLGLLVDSEDPVIDIEKPWEHLKNRKPEVWDRPKGATDDQVFLMTTCMESLFAADPDSLSAHYGARFQRSALPSTVNLESRDRHVIQDSLKHATRNCTSQYAKDDKSFALLGDLNPETLKSKLPSFARIVRILEEKL